MKNNVQFFFDFGSPTAYFAYMRTMRAVENSGMKVTWVPVLLGGILSSIGNTAPTSLPAKEKWFFDDLALWSEKLSIPFKRNPHFPINTLTLMRGAVALQDTEFFFPYLKAVYEAMWAQERNLGDPEAVAAVLASIGIGADDFLARVNRPEIKQKLKSNTEEAVERGVFGCPTFIVGERLIFGQDRFEFVEAAASA
jgi:2-hydroxychromene-2-carboxylate isomerase